MLIFNSTHRQTEFTMRVSTKAQHQLLGSLALLLVSATAFLPMPAKTAVSGVFTLTYVKPSVANGTNASGASIFISNARGTNKNTGQGKYLSGARVVNVDTAAMVQGNGTHSGQATFTDGTCTIVKRFTGATSTKMVKGNPESTFEGKWMVIRGTGAYAAATGNGTYKGRFETAAKYSVTWKGTISM